MTMSNAGGAVTDLSIKLYQSIRAEREERVYKHWHASSIAECPRAHYFKRLGVAPTGETEPTAAKLLRWEAGHHMEESIREHIQSEYPGLASNVRMISKELDLTGEYDNYSFEKSTLVEIKTVHDYAFIERDGQTTLKEHDGMSDNGRNKWKPKLEPYLHHELQQHAYVLLLAGRDVKVEKIAYVYISLSGRMVTYETPVIQERIDNVQNRLKVLNEAWDKQEPPVCICTPEHELWGPVMQYCDFRQDETCCDINLIKEKL